MPLLHRACLLTLLVGLLTSCAAPAAGPASRDSGSAGARPAGPKRITAVIMGEPPTLSTKINSSGSGGIVPGADALEEMLTAGLVRLDNGGALQPQLAEAVPTLENGNWRVFPDGRMETTWSTVANVRWADGTLC